MAVGVTSLFNSCKKDDKSTLKAYLTNYGVWELASLQVTHFKRNTPDKVDTLHVLCGSNTQVFSFSADGTCNYQYFQCNTSPYSGSWTFNTDSLILHVPIQMADTASKITGKSYPFARTLVYTLGSSTLVLLTGDLNSYYADDKTHARYRYSFIHPQAQ